MSPVFPLNLPKTCAHCHADAAYMAPYKIPTDQYANYLKSVHWEELSKRGDLSAPNCATCHGNHGAKPPSVNSVPAVCGTCHVFEEQLFNKSPHQPVLLEVGCVVCHSNHAIRPATDAMLAGPNAVCAQCHEPDSPGGKTAAQIAALLGKMHQQIEAAAAILSRAQASGMEVADAIAHQQEAQQALVQARQRVHAFAVAAVEEPVKTGLAVAAEDYRAGEAALHERNVRRLGLLVSLFMILLVIVGLWLTLRWIHSGRT